MEAISGSNVSAKDKLIQFLKETEDTFLSLWHESIIINDSDIYKQIVKHNGYEMYQLVVRSIMGSLADEEIEKLASKVAKERVASNSNIGEFVYNVNLGRSAIIKYINKSGIAISDLQSIIDKTNQCFDRFCFHAVTRYTELKDLELKEKVLFINQSHKDRLSLLGQMSSSFVHEFRNPLTAVMGFIKLIKLENPSLKYMETVEHELDQLKFRITQFLHASKLDIVDKHQEEINIEELITEIESFLYPSIVDGDVTVSTKIDPSYRIIAVKDEVKQVLVNIILNSIDALKLRKTDRKLSIECTDQDESLKFTISNNGPEIPEEMKEAIFEPFYTTKSLGTGIGLYVCRTIIEKHRGTIHCHSDAHCTSFIIQMPKVKERS